MQVVGQSEANPQRSVALLVSAVTVCGLALIAYGVAGYTGERLAVILTLMALGIFAERFAVGLFHSDVSLGIVAVLTAAVLAGPWGVALVAPAAILGGQLFTEAAWYKRLYNLATYALAGGAFAGIFDLSGRDATPDDWPAVILPAALGATAAFAINTGLVAAAIAASAGGSPFDIWRKTYGWIAPQYVVLGLTAVAAATTYEVMGVWGLAVFAAPLATLRHAFYHGANAVPDEAEPLPRAA